MQNERQRCCCNCGNNIRKKDSSGMVKCECSFDNHNIGYIECFEDWCRHWKKDRSWENDDAERNER